MIIELKVELEASSSSTTVGAITDKLTKCLKANIAELYVDGWIIEAKSVSIIRIN